MKDRPMDLKNGLGRIDLEQFPWMDLAAVHIWVPALEAKPKEGWLFNDGAVDTSVTWFDGMDLKMAVEVYWMSYQSARSAEAYEAHKKDPSVPLYSMRRSGDLPVEVHAETADGVVHVFEVSEVWHVETEAREK